MKTFEASSPTDLVAGESIRAAVDALGIWRKRGLMILQEHGIADPQPGMWYAWQAYLDAQRYIYEKIGPATIVEIGKKLVTNNEFPPQINSLEVALATLDDAYRLRHRGADIGSFRYEKINGQSLKMTIRNPYPCELDRGVVSALAQKFRPKRGRAPHVEHAEERCCRKVGAESCVLAINW